MQQFRSNDNKANKAPPELVPAPATLAKEESKKPRSNYGPIWLVVTFLIVALVVIGNNQINENKDAAATMNATVKHKSKHSLRL